MGILKQLFIPSFCESLFYPLYMEIFGKTYRHNPSWERLSLLPIGGSLLFVELSFCPSFLPFPLPCPALSFPSPPSVFPMDCLPIDSYCICTSLFIIPPPSPLTALSILPFHSLTFIFSHSAIASIQ